ncbi:MAG: DedA family protein [Planctomycetes bacterium]|nr:DedA family protein [Planctomycetota bacterium]MBL7008260.1 DedA family protein [Planctomycetota bacterium]
MESILSLLEQFPGPAAFGLLLLCGLGLPPWSEELVILGSGYFVAQGGIHYYAAVAWCWAGILAGDSVIYFLGMTAGERVYNWPILRRHLGLKQRARFNRRFTREGTKAVFLARFIPGFRMVAYLVAGNLGMRYWKFLLLDSIGALLTVPVSVALGWYFAENLDQAGAILRAWEIPLMVLGGSIFALLLWRSGWKRRSRLRSLMHLRAQRRQKRSDRSADDGLAGRKPDGRRPPDDSGSSG